MSSNTYSGVELMSASNVTFKDLLKTLSEDELVEMFSAHIRDIYSVDGLYFLEIEKHFGTRAAIDIDTAVWKVMGIIEMKRLMKVFKPDNHRSFDTFVKIMKATSWWLDLDDKEITYLPEEKRLILKNRSCRVQKNRIEKGLPEFKCQPVRMGFLKAFAETYNTKINVCCKICHPEPHPDDLWCHWELSME